MANAIINKTWRIDTQTVVPIDTRHMFVKSIRWTGGTTAGHIAEIQDPVTDEILWTSLAAGANNIEAELLETTWPRGFWVPDLDSGVLYITMR